MKKIKFAKRSQFVFRIGHNYTLRRPSNKYKVGDKVRLVCQYAVFEAVVKTAVIQAIRFIRFSDIETYGDWHLTASKEYRDKLYGANRNEEALEIMQSFYPVFGKDEIVEQIFFTVIKE